MHVYISELVKKGAAATILAVNAPVRSVDAV